MEDTREQQRTASPDQNSGSIAVIRNAKTKLGIVGIVIVVALAWAFNISPMRALEFFSTDNPHQTTQTISNR